MAGAGTAEWLLAQHQASENSADQLRAGGIMFGKEVTASTAESVELGCPLLWVRTRPWELCCPTTHGQATLCHRLSIKHTQLLRTSKAELQKAHYSQECSQDLCTVTHPGSEGCLPVPDVR